MMADHWTWKAPCLLAPACHPFLPRLQAVATETLEAALGDTTQHLQDVQAALSSQTGGLPALGLHSWMVTFAGKPECRSDQGC